MNFLQSRKLLWVFVAIGLVAVIIMIGAVMVSKKAPVASPKQELKVDKKDVSLTEWPEKFPADMPFEKGAKIIENYNATTNDGRFQATRSFETAKTLEENLKIYSDYFQKNGWQPATGIDLQNLKVISASKDGLQAVVTIENDNRNKIVDITLTQIPR